LNKDTYWCNKTYDSALLAAGCLLELVDNVMSDNLDNGAAIVRPPGHHSGIDYAMGFCFFNNVAIAAKHAIKKYGLKRILILDWDVQ
jgi:acetoin utilization deacetylase AcuC-like enzyme